MDQNPTLRSFICIGIFMLKQNESFKQTNTAQGPGNRALLLVIRIIHLTVRQTCIDMQSRAMLTNFNNSGKILLSDCFNASKL